MTRLDGFKDEGIPFEPKSHFFVVSNACEDLLGQAKRCSKIACTSTAIYTNEFSKNFKKDERASTWLCLTKP